MNVPPKTTDLPAGTLPEGATPAIEARRWLLGGRVQGVGYRPFVYHLARRYGLHGWVRNCAGRVQILARGATDSLDEFGRALVAAAPSRAQPQIMLCEPAAPGADVGFQILSSDDDENPGAMLAFDHPPCDDCLRELRDPRDRRYRYAFVTCTQCGPRYTLIQRLPYDRRNTSLAGFPLCPACHAEYTEPRSRRFHAEATACAACGPQPRFQARAGDSPVTGDAALAACVGALRTGAIVAVKGVGGYHLLCDARNADAIARLRHAKHRPQRPFALMLPERGADGLDAVREIATLDATHAALLRDPARPLVLLPRRADAALADTIAPGLNEIGVMLPYSPLHHLLLADLDAPVVATSANRGGEPVIIDTREAERQLARVADAYLHHDRPILRAADDPVYRVIAARPRPLRLGRGNAPLELALPYPVDRPLLAVGAHMKSTFALAWNDRVVVSPHMGDLEDARAQSAFARSVADLISLYRVQPRAIVCDAHPGYFTTRWARDQGLPLQRVYHHHAHAAALAGEYAHVDTWLVFTWDGVGYGADGSLWGGEGFLGRPGAWRRVASLRPFRLPGGTRAGREPWRSALGVCWEAGVTWAHAPDDSALLRHAWQQGLNSPVTSAAGRLFDAAAALAGCVTHASYEGQGPMQLEAACTAGDGGAALPLRQTGQGVWEADWAPLLAPLLDHATPLGARASAFHHSLALTLCAQAQRVRAGTGVDNIGLAGGVFQNRVLTERVHALLLAAGFRVYLGSQLPCNDAAISYGQIIETTHDQ
jgi:hydrogenase maturation protein HypF